MGLRILRRVELYYDDGTHIVITDEEIERMKQASEALELLADAKRTALSLNGLIGYVNKH